MRAGALLSRRDMPFAIIVSVADAGLKMNARSLREPSPLISPATRGVYGWPELKRSTPVMSIDGVTGHVAVPMSVCERCRSEVPHSSVFGLPEVVGDEKPPAADPPENELWSVEREYVYDMLTCMPRLLKPFTDAMS
jgi:hypothetical protein